MAYNTGYYKPYRTQADAHSLGESFDISAEEAKRKAYEDHDFAEAINRVSMAKANNRDGLYYQALAESLLERMRKIAAQGGNPYFDEYNRNVYRELKAAGYDMTQNDEFDPRYFDMSGENFGAGPALQTDYTAQGMPTQRGGLAYEDPEGRFRVSIENGEYTDDEWNARIQKAIDDYRIYGEHGLDNSDVKKKSPEVKMNDSLQRWRTTPYVQQDYDVNAYMKEHGLTAEPLEQSNPNEAYLRALDAYVRGTQASGGMGNTYAAQSGQSVLIGGGADENAYRRFAGDIKNKYKGITDKRKYY